MDIPRLVFTIIILMIMLVTLFFTLKDHIYKVNRPGSKMDFEEESKGYMVVLICMIMPMICILSFIIFPVEKLVSQKIKVYKGPSDLIIEKTAKALLAKRDKVTTDKLSEMLVKELSVEMTGIPFWDELAYTSEPYPRFNENPDKK